MKGIYQTFVSE